MDAVPQKDATGRPFWTLAPDGSASVTDLNGKPINIRVRCRRRDAHHSGPSPAARSSLVCVNQEPSGPQLNPLVGSSSSPDKTAHPACHPAVVWTHPGAQRHLPNLHNRQRWLRHLPAHPGCFTQLQHQVDF